MLFNFFIIIIIKKRKQFKCMIVNNSQNLHMIDNQSLIILWYDMAWKPVSIDKQKKKSRFSNRNNVKNTLNLCRK